MRRWENDEEENTSCNEWNIVSEENEHERYNENNRREIKMAKIYIGNLVEDEIREDDIKELFGLRETSILEEVCKVTIKHKMHKRNKNPCRDQNNCEYGRQCKFVHTNEL